MHPTSMALMKALKAKYCPCKKESMVADVGAFCGSDSCGSTYRGLFDCAYTGIDIRSGPNVDLVVDEDGDWSNAGQYDLVISGQCLEHVKHPWIWIANVASLVKPGGFVIIIAPWQFQEHRRPIDCWRILPDGMEALLLWGGFTVTEVGKLHCDCFGVGTK